MPRRRQHDGMLVGETGMSIAPCSSIRIPLCGWRPCTMCTGSAPHGVCRLLTNACTSPPAPRQDSACRNGMCVYPANCTIYQVCVRERSVMLGHEVYVPSYQIMQGRFRGKGWGLACVRSRAWPSPDSWLGTVAGRLWQPFRNLLPAVPPSFRPWYPSRRVGTRLLQRQVRLG